MKPIFIVLALLCSVATTPVMAAAPASEEPIIVRSQPDETGVAITLANLERERTVITITDLERKERVFHQVIKDHNGYRTHFNLESLKDGRYVVSVMKGDELRRQVVLKKADSVTCSEWK